MAEDFIAIDVSEFQKWKFRFERFAEELTEEAVADGSEYLLNVLRAYVPYQYVSRVSAYGTAFFSDKQRRYFFWALNNGIITVPYKRTQTMRAGWEQIGEGKKTMLVNQVPYASTVIGDSRTEQSRHSKKIGWKGIDIIVQERIIRMTEIFDAAIKKAMKRNNL
jgi:hypothetical protein